MVMTLDSGPRGREFDSRPVRYQVTTLRACVGARGLVVSADSQSFRLRFESHRGSFASNLEQVANLLSAHPHPQQDGK